MKKFSFVLVIFIFSSLVFAQTSLFVGEGGKNHIIMFSDSVLENGYYDKSDQWVTDKIRANFISVVQRFGGFKCVDLNDVRNILKIQKHLESGLYDESKSIELGKLVSAKEVVTIKTTRLPSGSYSINISIFNVETGEIIGMFSSPKTYESAESYSIQAHYDCVFPLLTALGVQQTVLGKQTLLDEMKLAQEQAEKNKALAKENEKIEAERTAQQRAEAERRAKIEADEREKREAKEKAEAEAAKKALAEKKARDAAAYAKAKQQNPFANETYICEFQNGSRYDTYKVKFVSQTECSVTVTSVDSRGNTKSFTGGGSYVYADEFLTVSARMQNSEVRHVQKIQWKGSVSFKNGYNAFYLVIPMSSMEGAGKIRAEFRKM